MHCLFDLFQTTVEAASVLRMTLALPHLPAEAQINCRFTIFDGFQIIVEYVKSQQPVNRERLQPFLFGYIQNYWLTEVSAVNISVFGLEFIKHNKTD